MRQKSALFMNTITYPSTLKIVLFNFPINAGEIFQDEKFSKATYSRLIPLRFHLNFASSSFANTTARSIRCQSRATRGPVQIARLLRIIRTYTHSPSRIYAPLWSLQLHRRRRRRPGEKATLSLDRFTPPRRWRPCRALPRRARRLATIEAAAAAASCDL